MENFSSKINSAVQDVLDDTDAKTVVYDLSDSSYFGGDTETRTYFNNFISSMNSTHPDADVRLVYLGDSDFNWMVDSQEIPKESPVIVLSMPFSHTYVFNYPTGDSKDLLDDKITFVYIMKHSPTDRYS